MRKAIKQLEGTVAVVRFTGKTGGSCYLYDEGRKRLDKGDTIRVTVKGHWLALLASENAETIK